MDPQTNATRQPLGSTLRLPHLAGLGLLVVLIAFQFLQIYRYREVVIRNDNNAALLARALEQLARVESLPGDLKNLEAKLDALKNSFEAASATPKLNPEVSSDVMKATTDELKRFYLVWKSQLNGITSSQAVMQAALEDMKRSQAADRAKISVLNTSSPKFTHGQNMFVGVNAGMALKAHTVAEGDDPMIGSLNAAFGENALATNQQGHSNTAVGTDALSMNTGGVFNVAVGTRTMAYNTTGSGNIAVGPAALVNNTSGRHNSAFGLQALAKLETGHDNSAFGRDAMFSSKKGSWNSAFGVDSLPGLASGEGNSAFGGEAGYTDEPTHQLINGSYNSWFGYQSGPGSLKQVSNSIAIGYRAKNTASNQAVIGNHDTTETILFGRVKVDKICLGSTCADEASFKALLDGAGRKN